jgi:predicted RNA binding protein YcfA (HicA-like mRNA interferase family)/predicted RNase H-like HicB family nuclease
LTILTAHIEFDPEIKPYVGTTLGIPGAHTQAATLDEPRVNLEAVTALVLQENASLKDRLPGFVGVQRSRFDDAGRLPVAGDRRIDRVLQQLGFMPFRQPGGHVFHRHPVGQATTVPHRAGRDMAPPLLRAVLDDIRVAHDAFPRALRS